MKKTEEDKKSELGIKVDRQTGREDNFSRPDSSESH